MRLYVKLTLLVVLFLSLAWVGGEAGREAAWDVWFAARCQAAHLLEDQRLQEQLVLEAQAELERRLERQMREFLAENRVPAPQVLPSDALALAHVADGAAGGADASPVTDADLAATLALIDTGWHSHPGPSIVSVVSGTATEYHEDDPVGTVHAAGTAFVDDGDGAHIVRNEGNTNLELIAFQILPAGAPRRIDEPAP